MIDALYIHIPFCASRCRYCDFSTAATRKGDPLMGRYAAAVSRLLAEARDIGLMRAPCSAYLGGGTPSLLGARVLSDLIADVCAFGRVSEFSFEANPESLGDEVIRAAKDAGATRVSVGVQSFYDQELKALGRIHSAAVAKERIAAAVAFGLDVSLDLMCGIPYQTESSWRSSLEQAVELGVGHVSCYPLMIEEGTALERLCELGKLPWPDDDAEADYMQIAAEVLGGAGLSRYEVASYAKPGKECRHNVIYWTGREYLGLGTAASSMLSRDSYLMLKDFVQTLPVPQDNASRFRVTVTSSAIDIAAAQSLADLAYDVEQLTAREAAAEDLMLGMRMTRGVSKKLLTQASQVIPSTELYRAVAKAVQEGLASWSEDSPRLTPTEKGWLMGNELYGLFWDLA